MTRHSIGKSRKTLLKPGPGRPRLYPTASDRQAAFRARSRVGKGGIALTTDDPGQGAHRVDLFLPTGAVLALRRLARHKGASQALVMADLITKADERVIKNLDEVAVNDYINGSQYSLTGKRRRFKG